MYIGILLKHFPPIEWKFKFYYLENVTIKFNFNTRVQNQRQKMYMGILKRSFRIEKKFSSLLSKCQI